MSLQIKIKFTSPLMHFMLLVYICKIAEIRVKKKLATFCIGIAAFLLMLNLSHAFTFGILKGIFKKEF